MLILAWDITQVIEHLSSKSKALSVNSSTAKKKTKQNKTKEPIASFCSLASFFEPDCCLPSAPWCPP
jgi:hypothetical protein